MTALSILRLIQPPGRIEAGSRIEFEGKDLVTLGDEEIRGFEIAVDDARTVRRIERIRDLLAERGDFLD